MYTLLTWLICALSNMRERLRPGALRWDRTQPWPNPETDVGHGVMYIQCCDCGLMHFFVLGESMTPVRPASYKYGLRAGRSSSEPADAALGPVAKARYYKWCKVQ